MSEAAAPPRHPDCVCRPGMREGSYSMDCTHHRLIHERLNADAYARLSGGQRGEIA